MLDDGAGRLGPQCPRGVVLKILVSGATGFTGRHFIGMARAAGHTVHALQADLLQPDALQCETAQVQPDGVVHLAAISFVGHADTEAFYQVNVQGTLNLLDALAMLRTRPQRVLVASSANVYGNCTESPIAEAQCSAPVNHYAASKLAMEHLARTRMNEVPVFFTRPFNYTGQGQSPNFVIPKLVQHFVARQPFVELGNLAVEREFNDVRFVCDAYLRLLEHAASGETYNVCTNRTYTLQQVIDALTELTGHVLPVQVNPALVRSSDITRLCGDPGKLQRVIGPPLDIHLRDTLAWMLQETFINLGTFPAH